MLHEVPESQKAYGLTSSPEYPLIIDRCNSRTAKGNGMNLLCIIDQSISLHKTTILTYTRLYWQLSARHLRSRHASQYQI